MFTKCLQLREKCPCRESRRMCTYHPWYRPLSTHFFVSLLHFPKHPTSPYRTCSSISILSISNYYTLPCTSVMNPWFSSPRSFSLTHSITSSDSIKSHIISLETLLDVCQVKGCSSIPVPHDSQKTLFSVLDLRCVKCQNQCCTWDTPVEQPWYPSSAREQSHFACSFVLQEAESNGFK